MSFLRDILDTTREAVTERERELPLASLKARVHPRVDDRRFRRALTSAAAKNGSGRLAVVAEFKRSAPSSDWKYPGASVQQYAQEYVRGGASALSILTENSLFGGSLDDLREARKAVDLPILRKDFVIGERQVYEAVDAGADAILLIVAALNDAELGDLHSLARRLGLDVLVEIREEAELHRALEIKADLIGINNRNLDTFHVDVDTTCRLVSKIPPGVTIVSESGLKVRSQLDDLAGRGVHAALIGSVLMNAPEAWAKCLELAKPQEPASSSQTSDQPAFA